MAKCVAIIVTPAKRDRRGDFVPHSERRCSNVARPGSKYCYHHRRGK
jgi:hypothetical protein